MIWTTTGPAGTPIVSAIFDAIAGTTSFRNGADHLDRGRLRRQAGEAGALTRRCCGPHRLRRIADRRLPHVVAVDPVRIDLVPTPGILPRSKLQGRGPPEARRLGTEKSFLER